MLIRPFTALRPDPERAGKVACLPYDVVTTKQARETARGNPDCFFHVSRAEIDLPDGTDPHSAQVYAMAVENLVRLVKDGALVREERPCMYVYRLTLGAHSQVGIVTCCQASAYEDGTIKRHEETRIDKETDRTRHIRELNAQAGPVFLVYRDSGAVDRHVSAVISGSKPMFDFVGTGGVRHEVWRVVQGGDFHNAFLDVEHAYIADGHHRCAAAVRVAAERKAASANWTGEEEYNWFLAVLFPASQVRIMAYNRLVLDLGILSGGEFLAQAGRRFALRETGRKTPSRPGEIMMYIQRKWYEMHWDGDPHASVAEALDMSVLQTRLFEPVLGISDPRTSKRLDFVGGIHGVEELVRRVDSGDAAVAFSMHPVAIADLMAVSDAGGIMPPKSTWFEPKLASGLFLHTL